MKTNSTPKRKPLTNTEKSQNRRAKKRGEGYSPKTLWEHESTWNDFLDLQKEFAKKTATGTMSQDDTLLTLINDYLKLRSQPRATSSLAAEIKKLKEENEALKAENEKLKATGEVPADNKREAPEYLPPEDKQEPQKCELESKGTDDDWRGRVLTKLEESKPFQPWKE